MGVAIGGALGYMLGDQKDAKKVAGREVWAAAGAMAGHLVHNQLSEGSGGVGVAGSAASTALAEENAQLKRSLATTRQRHKQHLDMLDEQIDDLIASYSEPEEMEEEQPVRAAPRRVVRVGNAAPAPQVQAAPRPPRAQPRQAPHPARGAPALPDYGSIEDLRIPTRSREYANLDEDANLLFGHG